MGNLQNSALNKDYASHLLVYLKENGPVSTGSLVPDIATNYRTVRKVIDDLESEGLVKLDKQTSPRKKFTVGLTEKGEEVADELLEIEKILE